MKNLVTDLFCISRLHIKNIECINFCLQEAQQIEFDIKLLRVAKKEVVKHLKFAEFTFSNHNKAYFISKVETLSYVSTIYSGEAEAGSWKYLS